VTLSYNLASLLRATTLVAVAIAALSDDSPINVGIAVNLLLLTVCFGKPLLGRFGITRVSFPETLAAWLVVAVIAFTLSLIAFF
jgi:hypothetical protein